LRSISLATLGARCALAAWIVEKFRSWTDCDGDPANAVSCDDMLANITLYWATGAICCATARSLLRGAPFVAQFVN
jgi:hypothetical protein